MLKTSLINPNIMSVLSYCGHGSKVLIADGNYPLAEKSGNAKKVYLGLTAGVPTVTQVLKAIHEACEIEKAEVMLPEDGSTPPIHAEFHEELQGVEFKALERFDFYDACMKDETVVLAILTGDKRLYSNILITIGCA